MSALTQGSVCNANFLQMGTQITVLSNHVHQISSDGHSDHSAFKSCTPDLFRWALRSQCLQIMYTRSLQMGTQITVPSNHVHQISSDGHSDHSAFKSCTPDLFRWALRSQCLQIMYTRSTPVWQHVQLSEHIRPRDTLAWITASIA